MIASRKIGDSKIFRKNIHLKKFCTELVLGASENLCDCVSLNFNFCETKDKKIETFLYVYGLPRDWLLLSNSLSLSFSQYEEEHGTGHPLLKIR
jgi:hypothetical protein